MSHPMPQGFAIGYARGKGSFRVFITTGLAIALIVAAAKTGSNIALVLGAFFAVAAFYFFPLIETGRPRLGAGEYGIFIEGFGVIGWRSVAGIRLASRAIRAITVHELEITLSRGLGEAVIADWRALPYHRLLMRLPWRMPDDETILVDLEPFQGEPQQTVDEIVRRWRYYK